MDVKTAGKKGIDEVNVEAATGKMVGVVQHEKSGLAAVRVPSFFPS
jgi:hypothetical protein